MRFSLVPNSAVMRGPLLVLLAFTAASCVHAAAPIASPAAAPIDYADGYDSVPAAVPDYNKGSY